MRKSKVKKMKLASLLLLSTVLIPDIAYADEEIDESIEAETYTVSEEVQNTEETDQTINEQDTETEENAETSVTTESEAGTQEAIPDVNTYNNDIETESGNVEEESADGGGGDILQPAEPDQQPEEEPVEIPAEPELNEETALPEGEEETPSDAVEDTEIEVDSTPELPVTEEPENSGENIQQETTENEADVPELPTEQINPVEPVDPEETPAELQEESFITAQPSKDTAEQTEKAVADSTETVEEGAAAAGPAKKKLYRYDYGDILNGISFSEESITEDLSTLDQRVTRVMSSKIIEEKDLTEAQKLKLEEKVKAEETSSYDEEELPNTGEADSTNYAFAGLLTIFGAALLFMSRKLKTDN